jgi:hypothetical protein
MKISSGLAWLGSMSSRFKPLIRRVRALRLKVTSTT